MDPALEHANLDPPKPRPVLARGLPVAVVAHVALAVALAWGVQWKHKPDAAHAAIPLPESSAPPTSVMGASPGPSTATGVMGAPPATSRSTGVMGTPPPAPPGAGAMGTAPSPVSARTGVMGAAPPADPPGPATAPAQIAAARMSADSAPPPRQDREAAAAARGERSAAAERTAASSGRVSPSFDCGRAWSKVEKMICADDELARLDRDLSRLHAQARSMAPDAGAFRRQNETEWKRRERNCADKDCVLQWYAQRREQLEAVVVGAPVRDSAQ